MQKTVRTNKHARTWDRMNEDDNLIELETEAAYVPGGGISQLMLAMRAEFPPWFFLHGIWSILCPNHETAGGLKEGSVLASFFLKSRFGVTKWRRREIFINLFLKALKVKIQGLEGVFSLFLRS